MDRLRYDIPPTLPAKKADVDEIMRKIRHAVERASSGDKCVLLLDFDGGNCYLEELYRGKRRKRIA